MPIKDRYGNNLRRGSQVRIYEDDEILHGFVVGSGHKDEVLVSVDEEGGRQRLVSGENLSLQKR